MIKLSKIEGGYYIKARCIQESEIQHAPPHFREIWDWLLKEANYQDNKYGKFTVKRGQCFRTYKDIRDGLSWNVGYRKERYSENQTKKAMKFLREAGMIATAKELGGVLITICNYEHYQNPKNYERTSESPTERTNGEPMGNQGGTDNNKNDKKEKNGKKEKTAHDISFEEFWEIAPSRNGKKIDRPQAEKKFLKLKAGDLANVIVAIHNYADSEMVKQGIGIKDPHRFISNRENKEYWKEWMEPEEITDDFTPTSGGGYDTSRRPI